MIDDIDKKILNILQLNARAANVEIAREVGLAPSAVLERIKKLENREIIRNYKAEIDAKALGLGLTALIAVRTAECGSGVGERLSELEEVLEVHEVAGEDCFFIKVRTRDTDSLGKLLREKIKAIPNVLNTRTTVVLKTYKETFSLDILNGHLRKPSKQKAAKKGKS
jgi:Lrp/AsnC family leucine-responsive transcriptional regulator